QATTSKPLPRLLSPLHSSRTASMGNMTAEIVAFILTMSGWILVSSTLPTDYWKVSSVDGTVITTATFWSNLWKTCVTDSTGVSNCKDFPSMLALDAYIQVCRALMIASVCLGFFGAVLALVGMKCTRIGGSQTAKARLAGLSGLCSLTACSLYARRITSEFFDPLFFAQKFELGAALFIGWAGSVLCILGGLIFCLSSHLFILVQSEPLSESLTDTIPLWLHHLDKCMMTGTCFYFHHMAFSFQCTVFCKISVIIHILYRFFYTCVFFAKGNCALAFL
uniref:Claudin n=1 Tax=Esox lucius TaxID=8010 RepID=A0A3P8Z5X1_ESOLU